MAARSTIHHAPYDIGRRKRSRGLIFEAPHKEHGRIGKVFQGSALMG